MILPEEARCLSVFSHPRYTLYVPADAPLIEWTPQLREAGLAPFAARADSP